MEPKRNLSSIPGPSGDTQTGRRFSMRLREKAARKEQLSEQSRGKPSGQGDVQPEPERSSPSKRSSEETTQEISVKVAKTSGPDDSILRTDGAGDDPGDSSEDLDITLQEESEEEDPLNLTLVEEVTTFNDFPLIDPGDVVEDTENYSEDLSCDQDYSAGSELELIIYSQSTSSDLDISAVRKSSRITGYTVWDIED